MYPVRNAFASAALAGVLALTTPVHAQQAVGVNAAVRNSVRTQPVGEAALRPAVVRGQVRVGDVIVSGAQSQLQVLLRDQSVFTVGSNARVTIDRFVIDTERGAGGASASVARGAFRFVSGRGAAPRSALRTPVASIGVRGTIVETVVGPDALFVLEGQPGVPPFSGSPDEASLIVLRGPGPRATGFDTPGAIDVTGGGSTWTLETPGLAMFVWQGGAFGPFSLTDEASERLNSLLRSAPTSNADSAPGDVVSAGLDSGDAAFFGGDDGRMGPQTVEPVLDCKPLSLAGGPTNPNISPNAPVCGDSQSPVP